MLQKITILSIYQENVVHIEMTLIRCHTTFHEGLRMTELNFLVLKENAVQNLLENTTILLKHLVSR